MFSTLDKGASSADILSILNGKYGKKLSAQLNGCTNMCQVGATAGLSVRGRRCPPSAACELR